MVLRVLLSGALHQVHNMSSPSLLEHRSLALYFEAALQQSRMYTVIQMASIMRHTHGPSMAANE